MAAIYSPVFWYFYPQNHIDDGTIRIYILHFKIIAKRNLAHLEIWKNAEIDHSLDQFVELLGEGRRFCVQKSNVLKIQRQVGHLHQWIAMRVQVVFHEVHGTANRQNTHCLIGANQFLDARRLGMSYIALGHQFTKLAGLVVIFGHRGVSVDR